MALQASGVIAFSDLATEFSDTTPYSLSEFIRGGSLVPDSPENAAIPATTSNMSLSDFYSATVIQQRTTSRTTSQTTSRSTTTSYSTSYSTSYTTSYTTSFTVTEGPFWQVVYYSWVDEVNRLEVYWGSNRSVFNIGMYPVPTTSYTYNGYTYIRGAYQGVINDKDYYAVSRQYPSSRTTSKTTSRTTSKTTSKSTTTSYTTSYTTEYTTYF